MEPITVAFFGISGSGKGTQAELLMKALKDKDPGRAVVRVEMGALAREFMASGTSLANLTKDIVTSGGLLPSFVPIYLLTKYLNEQFSGDEHLILDGTCRRPDQSRAVDDMMRRLWNRPNLQAIAFELSKEEAQKRLLGRGQTRADDASPEAMQKRFSWYEEHVVSSIVELEKCGWAVHRVNADPDVETIRTDISQKLGIA